MEAEALLVCPKRLEDIAWADSETDVEVKSEDKLDDRTGAKEELAEAGTGDITVSEEAEADELL